MFSQDEMRLLTGNSFQKTLENIDFFESTICRNKLGIVVKSNWYIWRLSMVINVIATPNEDDSIDEIIKGFPYEPKETYYKGCPGLPIITADDLKDYQGRF